MITPAFELSQDPDFLTISIRVPYARVAEVDLYIDGEDFKFYAKPYFLRLTLPGKIVEDGREKALYDSDKGNFTVKVPKVVAGEYFEGLDMLTALLAPKGSRSAKPLVEELGGTADHDVEEDEDEFDWEIEQSPFVDLEENIASSGCPYGFGNLRWGVFKRLQNELSDVIDLKEPDSTTWEERRQLRLAAEEAKFDSDHYLADLFEDDTIQHLLKYKAWWADAHPAKQTPNRPQNEHKDASKRAKEFVVFYEDEKQQLRKFPNKDYLLEKKSCSQAYLSLVDIILAYTYEVRCTEGEINTESPWNIRKLSSTLCWLGTYHSLQEMLVSFSRRVLCYPLYRHFQLALKAIDDAALIFQLGKPAVLKCLLGIHEIFRENDPAYILNDLYITDYCIWIQRTKSEKLTYLAESLQNARVTKTDLDLELEELEKAAYLVQEEEGDTRRAGHSVPLELQSASETGDDSSEEASSSSCESEASDSAEEDSYSCQSAEEVCLKGLPRAAGAEQLTAVNNPTRSKDAGHADGESHAGIRTLTETGSAQSTPELQEH
ncbi:protein SHQ1 homolog isoform X2 [Callorhinchus milii]|uniref:protein SHQ1 homolog isoform X2 n=1 Tax=Callorhinchus milii TaxID=7868 RepID=UPI001C3F6C14|nr:protein SHQ1 homolog isoform X2 [Callorhinchus milii]